jgi:hypothetical protein
MYPSIVARQKLGKDVPTATSIIGGVVFNAVYLVSNEVGDYFFPELLVAISIVSE